ncbi:hypothetical protein BB560_000675 [Smittium megazygosporum]|uniref:3-hydroxy-3-methylglutaryl coenzyme A reductase n=1 Tax=Smittium megazygosporum TaxID=133381 RepID=A0A2T9ZJP3_9FUNG|nr:hypothetical protein BB560_000675 [Smittium megazygosporum]
MFGIARLCSRKPIETLSIVAVISLVYTYWFWSSLKNNELFKRPNLEVPKTTLYYSIESIQDSEDLSFSLLNPSTSENTQQFQAHLITLRTHGAFDSFGVLQPEYQARIRNLTFAISNLKVNFPESSSEFDLSHISVLKENTPVFLSPFSTLTSDLPFTENNILPSNSYFLLDKRYNVRKAITGAQGLVISLLFDSSNPSNLPLIKLWSDELVRFLLKNDLLISDHTISSSASSFSPSSSSIPRSSLYSSFLKDRSAFPHLAVVSQNLFWRISELIANSSTSEFSLVLITYIIVSVLLVQLFRSMKSFGSKLSLALTVITCQIFSILLSLAVLRTLGISIEFISMSEGLPYFLISHGFDKHLLLTRSVLLVSSHHFKKHIIPKLYNNNSKFKPLNPQTVSHLVVKGLKNCSQILIREYSFELIVLSAGYLSGIHGLVQFSIFSIFVIIFDIIFMITVFVSILTLKLNLIYARSSVFKTHVIDSDKLETINYRSLIQNASKNDSNLFSKIKLLTLLGYILIIFTDFKLLPSPFTLKSSSSLPQNFKNIDSAGSEQLDALIKPLLFSISSVLPSYPTSSPVTLSISPPLEFFIKPLATLPSSPSYIFSLSYITSLFSSHLVIVTLVILSLSMNVYLLSKPSSRKNFVSKIPSRNKLFGLNITSMGSLPENPSNYSPSQSSESDADSERKPSSESLNSDEKPLKTDSLPASVLPLTSTATEKPEVSSDSTSAQDDNIPYPSKEKLDSIIATNIHRNLYETLINDGPDELTDEEIIILVQTGLLPQYSLEAKLRDPTRAVKVRRSVLFNKIDSSNPIINQLPYKHYNYASVINQCCENVVGFMPLPVGIAGPLLINNESIHIPMATTEGALVASTSRGCKAISLSGGVTSCLVNDGMTRGPCLELPSLKMAHELKCWIDSEEGFSLICSEFESTSRFAKLKSLKVTLAGRLVFLRFRTFTGDAMGMNMISKGCEKALRFIMENFEGTRVVTISGNYCTDKKPAAINWIEGRGKSIVAEAVIPESIVNSVLKTTVDEIVQVNTKKNLVGSAMAGALGGFNAHAANILTAIYIATGQDPAQNVESSNCLTFMQKVDGNLVVSVTMPSIEVGTVGGGTSLLPQQSCLSMLNCLGPNRENPGANAQRLAKIVAGAVMAGELSLIAALTTGDLVKSHIKLNRKPQS